MPAEVDEDHVDDIRTLRVGNRPLDHLLGNGRLLDVGPRTRCDQREHEHAQAEEARHGESDRQPDGGPLVDEMPGQEPEDEDEQHRGERLDRELRQRQVWRAPHDIEARHAEADTAEHQRRGDTPGYDGGTDGARDDHAADRQVHPVADQLREHLQCGERRAERRQGDHADDHDEVRRAGNRSGALRWCADRTATLRTPCP